MKPQETTLGEGSGLGITLSDRDDGGALAVLSGRIDDRAPLVELARRMRSPAVIDLAQVRFINSVGVREWIRMMHELEQRQFEIRLERCSEPMVKQMNMIVEAKGVARVTSFFAPYACDGCGYEGTVCLVVDEHRDDLLAHCAPTMPCPECDTGMDMIEIPERYFYFLTH